MTQMWTKQLCKDADLKFYVQAGAPFWPSSMLEPLTVVVVFPLSCCQLQRTMDGRGRPHTEKVIEQLDLKFQGKVDEEDFLAWRSPCLDCKTKIIEGHGIVCANFFTKQRRISSVYCGEYYRITRTTHEEGGWRGKRV